MWLRSLVVAACAFGGLCSAVGADVRSGSVQDPVGDSGGAPAQDIVSASAAYDSAGSLTVTATFDGELATRPDTHWTFDLATQPAAHGCAFEPVFTLLFGLFGETRRAVGFLGDAPDLFDVPAELSGTTLTATWRTPALANRGYGCVSFKIGQESGPDDYVFFDRIDRPITFAAPPGRRTRRPARRLPAACDDRLGRDRALCVKRRLALDRCATRKRPARRATCRRRARRVRL